MTDKPKVGAGQFRRGQAVRVKLWMGGSNRPYLIAGEVTQVDKVNGFIVVRFSDGTRRLVRPKSIVRGTDDGD